MKVEIKLNQEQFDMLLTALVQVAQGCIRMAESWETTNEPDKDIVDAVIKQTRETKGKTRGGSLPKYDGFISSQAIYHDVSGGITQTLFLEACRKLGIEAKRFPDSKKYFIPSDRRGELVGLLKRVKERMGNVVEE